MKNKIQFFSQTICLVFLLGCDSNPSNIADKNTLTKPQQHLAEHHKHHPTDQPANYQKPGANIQLSHNYDGQTALGETETIALTFHEQYLSGQLYLRLKPDASLSIKPAIEDFVFSMEDVTSHSIELTVSAKSAGKYLLNIFASVMDESGRPRNRVMAVAIYVSDGNHRQSKPQASSPTDKVIILPSEESGS